MACLSLNEEDVFISIPGHEEQDGVIFYLLEIKIANVKWCVKRRYNEFVVLHGTLVSDHCVEKDILPPKKYIGNKSESFIERRKRELEIYINTVYKYLQKLMPRVLAVFLEFHIYEIDFLINDLAYKFFTDGAQLLQKSGTYKFDPVQLYAISERLKQPCPSLETDKKYDFSHLLDFVGQLKDFTIQGSLCAYGTSNIYPNLLRIDLSPFKNLETLTVDSYPVDQIYNMGNIRDTVKVLKIYNTNVTSIVEMAMCEEVHKRLSAANDSHVWFKVTQLDLSYNQIDQIDEAIKLLPHIESLSLNNNKLSVISNVTLLPRLSELYLACNNFISLPEDLHLRLGNIVFIDLSQNYLTTLSSFAKLYCLVGLDVSCNKIQDVEEVRYLRNLPCLENLRLTGNPVSTIVDYRIKVLEPFGKRAADICLDNEKPNQKELDTVSVLQALRIVKEGKSHLANSDSLLFSAEIPIT